MKLIFTFALVFSVSLSISVYGQTKSEVATMASQTTVYVRNGVELFPKFDKTGQICQVVLQPSRFSDNKVFLGRILVTGENIEEILDALAPQNARGEKTEVWGAPFALGQTSTATYNYDNVHVVLSNSINFGRLKPGEAADKIGEPVKPHNSSIFGSAEVVKIIWTKRQCVEN